VAHTAIILNKKGLNMHIDADSAKIATFRFPLNFTQRAKKMAKTILTIVGC
jgi:hypothetical protein